MPQNPIHVLNHLVEVCLNGQHGFQEAASVVRDAHLSSVLLNYASQREQFAAQLMYQVSRLGGRPEHRGSLAGLAHRRWMDVRSALGGDDLAVLRECLRGERHALSGYDRALKAEMPQQVRNLLHDQQRQIQAAQQDLGALQDRVGREQLC